MNRKQLQKMLSLISVISPMLLVAGAFNPKVPVTDTSQHSRLVWVTCRYHVLPGGMYVNL